MVRRLKEDIRNVQGGFPKRNVDPVVIDRLPTEAPELGYPACSTSTGQRVRSVLQALRAGRKPPPACSWSDYSSVSFLRLRPLHAA